MQLLSFSKRISSAGFNLINIAVLSFEISVSPCITLVSKFKLDSLLIRVVFILKANSNATFSKFMESAKVGTCSNKNGITAYYSNACPFTDYYTNQLLREYAEKKNVPLTIKHIKSKEDGHKMPIPWIINSIFYKGELVTLEMKVERYLDKIIE